MRVLITSGGTKIPIDSVRSITNMSNGTFGSQIAERFYYNKTITKIDFLYAKNSKLPVNWEDLDPGRQSIDYHEYETFWEYEAKLTELLAKKPDIVILAAAVSDYEVENPVDGKVRSADEMIIKLKPLPKLISKVKEECPDCTLCGFKLLVGSTKEELIVAANKSIEKNGCDIVIANDISTIKDTEDHSMIVVKPGWYHEYFRKDYNLPETVKLFCMMNYVSRKKY